MAEGYIAIDLGAESGRAVVGMLADGKVSLEEVHRFPHEIMRLPTGLHWDVTGLWREICVGLRHAAQWAGQNGVDIVSDVLPIPLRTIAMRPVRTSSVMP